MTRSFDLKEVLLAAQSAAGDGALGDWRPPDRTTVSIVAQRPTVMRLSSSRPATELIRHLRRRGGDIFAITARPSIWASRLYTPLRFMPHMWSWRRRFPNVGDWLIFTGTTCSTWTFGHLEQDLEHLRKHAEWNPGLWRYRFDWVRFWAGPERTHAWLRSFERHIAGAARIGKVVTWDDVTRERDVFEMEQMATVSETGPSLIFDEAVVFDVPVSAVGMSGLWHPVACRSCERIVPKGHHDKKKCRLKVHGP